MTPPMRIGCRTFYKLAAVGNRPGDTYAFTKADRILKRSEFLFLSKYGKRIQNEYFIAVFYPNRFGRTRLGITVTRKVGRAVIRNRIKRLTRETFRLNRHEITGHWDINLIAKNRTAEISSDRAFLSLRSIFKEISKQLDS